jgi:hypothetical protein
MTAEAFEDRVTRALDEIVYRRVETDEDMREIEKLRLKAYGVHGKLALAPNGVIDDMDFDDHAYVFALYHHDRLASTVRIQHVEPGHRVSHCGKAFPDEVKAMLDAGQTIIDPAKFAVDPDLSSEMAWLRHLTLRPSIVAAARFRADRVLQFCVPEHAAFYRRVFQASVVVPPREYKGYGVPVTLLSTDVLGTGRRLLTRYPSFKSTAQEQVEMFERPALTRVIAPTARLVPHGEFGTELPL